MPTYEFRCPRGHEFEKFYRSIGGAEAKATCPQCGELAERVMSAAGFAFKGSGFYLTDYGKNAHREKGTAEPKTGAPAGEAGGENGKAEPKTEAASGTAPAPPSASSPEPKKSEPKAADPKPAAAPPKKSSDE
jgi:putative FmdB family regulatory protein